MGTASRTCTSCNTPVPADAAFCPTCGAPTPAQLSEELGEDFEHKLKAKRQGLAVALGKDYELGELLGMGGFAEVYAAFDRRLKRRVAVKVLREELRGDAAVRERFRREAESVAQLRHPHVVPIYAVGEEEDLAYFVMPLLEGQTLAAALERESRWSFPEVCRILREAASALEEAHRGGLIHRDVKPENIMLDGPSRRVVIMDFGIAKAVDEQASALTATGMLVGSPQFMSPEQAAGDTVDAFSDQYSLALVGYRMLAGRLPFQADSMRALLFKQATEQPPALEDLRPDIPASLNAVITRALAKERSQRFPTMGELENALTKVASEVAGDFRRQRTTPPLAERWTSALSELYDRPWRFAIAAIVGLLLFCYTYPRGESRGARETMGARDTALTAARLALDSMGVAEGGEQIYFGSNSTLYRFLQEALDPVAAESAAASADVWWWRVWYQPPQYLYAWASFGARGQMLEFSIYVPDSLVRGTISKDSALSLSVAFARRLGYDSMLGVAREFQSDVPTGREYEFGLSLPSALPKRGEDSVTSSLYVSLAGDRVTRLFRSDMVPRSSTFRPAATTTELIGAVAGGVVLLLLFIALGIAAKRAAFDAVQWGTAFRLAMLVLIVHTAADIVPGIPSLSTPLFSEDNVATIVNHVTYGFIQPELIGGILMMLVLLAATESWLNETRPELVAGLTDVGRLRLRTPEVLRALPAGMALGVSLAALRATASMAGRFWLHLPVEPRTAVPEVAVVSRWPVIGVMSDVGVTAMAFAMLAFLVAGALRVRRPWLAPLVAALLWTGLTMAMRGSNVMTWQAVLDGIVVGLTALVVLRHGLLAAALALFLSTTIPIVYDLLWAGGPFRAAGIEALLVLLLPVVFGIVIYRQRPRSLASATPPLPLGT